jgi:hypothetical protein
MLANGKVMYHLDLRLVSRSVGNRLADWLAIIEHGMSRRRSYNRAAMQRAVKLYTGCTRARTGRKIQGRKLSVVGGVTADDDNGDNDR